MTAEPALAHEITAQLHALSVRRARLRWCTAVFIPVLLVAVVWVLVAARAGFVETFWFVALTILLVVFAAVVWQVPTPPGVGGWVWRPASRRLLAEQAWRESPVKVLNVRGTVLILPDGLYVRVHGLPAVARAIAVRTRRVWLVGPDTEGRLAVRVDGLHTPWPAQRTPPMPGTAALPPDEPIAAVVAQRAEVLTGRVFVFQLVAFSFVALLNVLAGALSGAWTHFLQAATFVLLAVTLTVRHRHHSRLQPSAPWLRVEATAPSWRVRRRGLATGTVTVTFPHGRRCVAQLDLAPLDLFANVVREKGLWVAGDRVAGFPDYAIVAAARFR